jgi:hypothetical protein
MRYKNKTIVLGVMVLGLVISQCSRENIILNNPAGRHQDQ